MGLAGSIHTPRLHPSGLRTHDADAATCGFEERGGLTGSEDGTIEYRHTVKP